MPKRVKRPTKKRLPKIETQPSKSATQSRLVPTNIELGQKGEAASKQSRVVALLRSPGGATIAAMMGETGWQQHSVRGFLAGVIRRKLKLKLQSNKIDGQRVYSIEGEGLLSGNGRQAGRRLG